MDVTVVIPVFNPGPFIEPCIDGLLAQTLGPQRCEFVFVDDGSTDETPARLDDLAAAHANVLVRHEPNSGWPGRPRNIGIDSSHGEFVFFCDQDDWLAPDALETLVATARRTGADVVVGKMVGRRRAVPIELFRNSRDSATVYDSGLMWALTPHKLFRRTLLQREDLRFGEGRRRLEDHTFVTDAYFAADVVSVVADRPIYHHIRRPDSGNAAYSGFEPVSYYGYAREAMDIVARHTEPGPDRERAMWRFLRSQLLDRLSEPIILRTDDELLATTFAEVRKLLLERYPRIDLDRPWPLHRARAAAIRADRPDLLLDIARRAAGVEASGRTVTATADGSTWRLAVESTMRDAAGDPVPIVASAEGWHVPSILTSAAEDRPSSSEEILTSLRGRLTLREHTSFEEWIVPGPVTTCLAPAPTAGAGAHTAAIEIDAHLDVRTIAGGRPLPAGRWHVRLGLTALGLNRAAGLPISDEVIAALPAATVYGTPAVFVQPVRTADGCLRIDVRRTVRALAATLAANPLRFASSTASDLRLALPLVAGDDFTAQRCWVELRQSADLPAVQRRAELLSARAAGMEIQVPIEPDRRPAPGGYQIWLTFRRDQPSEPIGTITIDTDEKSK
jgi:glycosyltransferase involved in cell wall biosynthesis